MWGKWFEVPKSGVDTENNTIYFSTNHFTSFTVQPTMIESLSPQEIQDVGYSPFKTQVNHEGVTVSPQGGSVMATMTELVLPGKNGFDFVLKRTYDSATARGDSPMVPANAQLSIGGFGGNPFSNPDDPNDPNGLNQIATSILKDNMLSLDAGMESMIKKYFQNNGDYSYSMGLGWRLNLPYIRGANNTVLVRLPDGSFYSINQMMKLPESSSSWGVERTLVFENHLGSDFTLKVTQERKDYSIVGIATLSQFIPGWQLKSAELILKDGTTYEIDKYGRTRWITDPTGLNHIELHYKPTLELDYIKDSMGRIIKFEYDHYYIIPKISKIKVENDAPYNREINYYMPNQTGFIMDFGNNIRIDNRLIPLLMKATHAGGREQNRREWNYDYGFNFLFSGSLGVKVNYLAAVCSIIDVFTKGLASQISGLSILTIKARMQCEWDFPLHITEGPGIGYTVIDYYQRPLFYNSVEGADYFLGLFPTATEISINLVNRLMVRKVSVYKTKNSSPVRVTDYSYNVVYYDYDQFYTKDATVNDGRTKTVYSYTVTVKQRNRWIDIADAVADIGNSFFANLFRTGSISGLFVENQHFYEVYPYNTDIKIYDADSDQLLESTIILTDTGTLRPTRQTTLPGIKYRRVDYTYDSWGNVTYIEDYGYSGTPITVSRTKTWMYYLNVSNPSTDAPWKVPPFSTTQPALTRARRDLMVGKIVANHVPDKVGNQNIVYLHTYNFYSVLGQLKETYQWNKDHWARTKFDYDPSTGNLTKKTNPKEHETIYEYDLAHGLPTKIIEKNVTDVLIKTNETDMTLVTKDLVTNVGYEYCSGWKLWQKNPKGDVTQYEYDYLGRTTLIIAPDDDDAVDWVPSEEQPSYRAQNPKTIIAYDNVNLISTVTDALLKQTKYYFDPLGKLTDVIKDVDGLNIKTTYHYDSLGRIDSITDPQGNVTAYAYDKLNRITKVTYPKSNNPSVITSAVNLVISLSYNDDVNTVTIVEHENSETGNEIGRTVETTDWANRLLEAVQECTYNATTESYNWKFGYDSFGNKVYQIDPLTNQTIQTFDNFGHLTKVQRPDASLVKLDDTQPESAIPVLNYEYDDIGNKTNEIDAKGNQVDYDYDELGRVSKVTTQSTNHHLDNQLVTSIAHTYYDENGNKARVIDPNGKEWNYTYSVRGWLLTEEDPRHNITRYQYDALGNKIAVTDPRSNGTDRKFTTWYIYDNVSRLVRTVLPDNTPPSAVELSNGSYDNPYTVITYDDNGNKLTERDASGVITSYTYTPRNLVEKVDVAGQLKATYTYDAKGNQTEIKDAVNQTTKQYYDSLGRLRKVTHPLNNFEEYSYDPMGNKTAATDGEGDKTQYFYNSLGYLTSVKDPLNNLTQYHYDLNGNQVKIIAPNDKPVNKMETKNYYDQMNRLYKTVDTLGKSTMYSYDANGNRQKMTDRRGSAWIYQYYDNNQLERVDVTNGAESYWVSYTYDKAGNRVQVEDSGNTVNYNTDQLGVYQADPLNRVNNMNRVFGGETYTTAYQYENNGLLKKILYPETTNWLEYKYNNQNQLNEVVGFTLQQGVSYKTDGALSNISYSNGVTAGYEYDNNRRLNDLQVSKAGNNILKLGYSYYDDNNIDKITDGGKVKSYQYDDNGQLTKATTPGKFVEEKPAAGFYGLKLKDYRGSSLMDFMPAVTGLIGLDYNASSVGINFGMVAPNIKKILLAPDKNYETHRITDAALDLYTSDNNATYTVIQRSDWEFVKDSKGVITITLKATIATQYLKLHVKYDNWDKYGNPVNDTCRLQKIEMCKNQSLGFDLK